MGAPVDVHSICVKYDACIWQNVFSPRHVMCVELNLQVWFLFRVFYMDICMCMYFNVHVYDVYMGVGGVCICLA